MTESKLTRVLPTRIAPPSCLFSGGGSATNGSDSVLDMAFPLNSDYTLLSLCLFIVERLGGEKFQLPL